MDISIKKRIANLKLSNKITLSAKHKAYLLRSTAELLQEGFSLKQSLNFLEILMLKQKESIRHVSRELEQGKAFEHSLKALGYSLPIIAQLFYGQRQGRFISTLFEVSQQLEESDRYLKKLTKVIIYPLLLSLFLIGMLFAMRTFILPHIVSFISQEVYEEQLLVRILVGFFTYLPQIMGITAAVILLVYGGIDFYLLRKEPIMRFRILVRFPFISRWVRSYCSYKIARELGHFFSSGYSIQQTIQVLVEYPIDPFLSNIALVMEQKMQEGVELAQILADLKIFTPELPIVIYQGELTSQTAQKCKLYSGKIHTDLMTDIEQKMGLIQPVLFIIIGLLVMAMYLMMMLPMLTMDGL